MTLIIRLEVRPVDDPVDGAQGSHCVAKSRDEALKLLSEIALEASFAVFSAKQSALWRLPRPSQAGRSPSETSQ